MFGAATMIAAFILCLGIFYSPCQVHHKLLGYSFNSTWIITLFVFITLSILFFQMRQMHGQRFRDGLVALEFPQGEETGSPWFWRIISCLSPRALGRAPWNLLSQLLRQPLDSQNKSLPVGPPSGKPPLLLVTWGVCHRSSLSLTLSLDPGELVREGSSQKLEMP